MKYYNTKICRKRCMLSFPEWCLYLFCYCCKYSNKKNLVKLGVIKEGCKKFIVIKIGDSLIKKERDKRKKRREYKELKRRIQK